MKSPGQPFIKYKKLFDNVHSKIDSDVFCSGSLPWGEKSKNGIDFEVLKQKS
jgi:hypothetical protein